MKEKLSLMRKAYNFKQSQWLDPTKSFRTFLLEQKLGASLKLNQKISIFQKLEAGLFYLGTLLTKPLITYRVSKKRYYGFVTH